MAAAYPGTPSTEILENLAKMEDIYVEWSTNEKVAMEVAMGASYGGVRALAIMKHVGLNVAADPFFAASMTGVRGGLVVISCDDPGMHSSQNEQDNRHYRPVRQGAHAGAQQQPGSLRPDGAGRSGSARSSTRPCCSAAPPASPTASRWSRSRKRPEIDRKRPQFTRDPHKFVMVPSNARPRHPLMEERIQKLSSYVETFPRNEIILQDRSLGIISSGVAYQHAREVFQGASFLKLVTSYPLPQTLIRRFASEVRRVLVVEELDPFIEESLKAMGLSAIGKEVVPIVGELNPDILEERAALAGLIPKPAAHVRREEARPRAAAEASAAVPGVPSCGHLLCAEDGWVSITDSRKRSPPRGERPWPGSARA